MPKINQKEYDILKGLDDKWKWIARDDYLAVYDEKPIKRSVWTVGSRTSYLFNDDLFQFIQWSDEEPYNIAELIEEYEYSTEHVSHVVNERVKALGKAWSESEETEVNKDIEWLKKEIKKIHTLTFDAYEAAVIANNKHFQMKNSEQLALINKVLELINQLDEPEILSPEWVDKNMVYADVNGNTEDFLNEHSVRNLLVPKQEVTERQAYDKIAESFPATAKEIESVLEKYYSSMLIEFSEEMHKSIMRAFDVETISKTIEALTGMTLEQIVEEVRNGGIVPKQEEQSAKTVADVIADFYKSAERLIDVLGTEVKEEEE